MSNKACTPGGDGSVITPFCTISAAAAVVEPGQTVLVQPGTYAEAVTLTRSGTEAAPIVFRAVTGPGGIVTVDGSGSAAAAFTVAGVNDVEIEGFRLVGGARMTPLVVDGSDRVTVDGITTMPSRAPAALHLTGGSSGVTVVRSMLANQPGVAPSLLIDDGVAGATVASNQLTYGGLLVAGAPGTSIVNNTVLTSCVAGIVADASPGVSIENNIVRTNMTREAYASPATATAIAVSASSVNGTVADHNLIDPITGGALYSWNGTAHQDVPSFQQASGQGEGDLAADPMVGPRLGGYLGWHRTDPASPAVDSADATARGVTATDFLDNPRTDNPQVADTGVGYHDRGAVEVQGDRRGGERSLRRKAGGDPLTVTATNAPEYVWPVNGRGGLVAYKFDGDLFWRVTETRTLDHTFRQAGHRCVRTWFSDNRFRSYSPGYEQQFCTVVGAHYTPVAPTRLLDTRAAIGTTTTTPVSPNSEILLSVPQIGGVPAAEISSAVLNVTVTQPTAAGFVTVYPDRGSAPGASNVNFVAKETVPNLVTVQMDTGGIRFRNTSSGTVHLVADLQGFYSRLGSGLKPVTPTRVLDTRTGSPIGGNGNLRLDLSAKLPADATAAILNVTVTKPTANGVLKVYPDGSPVPVASNLNFVTGQTIPNLVIVPVVAGRVMIRNASAGTTHVVADLAGYFGSAASGADQSFVPRWPSRVADTRNGLGWEGRSVAKPLSPRESDRFTPVSEPWEWCDGGCPPATAAVLNLTVTTPAAAGVLTAHPADAAAPTASNVNFVAGETASNLAVVKVGADGRVAVFNNSSGSTHIIVDQSGNFIAAP
ncbi:MULTISPECIES: right-handed parallel beta-helix repeat-containing protein [unclassified Micromonospora]|uniref:right-handed parallel beta-helix repeat-containing protein n=1 Tax=unclassified Micromonospora TaxID=2617518 RepID=UPI002FF1C7BB